MLPKWELSVTSFSEEINDNFKEKKKKKDFSWTKTAFFKLDPHKQKYYVMVSIV